MYRRVLKKKCRGNGRTIKNLRYKRNNCQELFGVLGVGGKYVDRLLGLTRRSFIGKNGR